MRVLVTGGAGYIGATTVRLLLQRGHEVWVIDNLSKGHRAAVPAMANFVQGDVGDRASVDRVLDEFAPQAVLHFAAYIEAGESMTAPEKYFRNNSAATLTLLEALHSHGVNKFIFSSTAALYGEPEEVPITETAALRPTNAYGESKLLVEQMLVWFQRVHGIRYASLRYFNAAGSDGSSGECHHPETHLIPIILQAAAGLRDAVSVYGADYPTPDGTCVRDYIHVSDLAEAHLCALNALNNGAGDKLIYNLGNGRGFSVREVIESVRRVTGREVKTMEGPRRAGDPAVLIASSERIRRELGWEPQHPDLDEIVASAWGWMQRNPEGFAADLRRAKPINQ